MPIFGDDGDIHVERDAWSDSVIKIIDGEREQPLGKLLLRITPAEAMKLARNLIWAATFERHNFDERGNTITMEQGKRDDLMNALFDTSTK